MLVYHILYAPAFFLSTFFFNDEQIMSNESALRALVAHTLDEQNPLVERIMRILLLSCIIPRTTINQVRKRIRADLFVFEMHIMLLKKFCSLIRY